MKKLSYITLLSILFVCCNNETKKSTIEYTNNSVSSKVQILPIHGELNREELAKYFPGVTDTIKDLRIIGSEKIDLINENGIIISILHNTGTFDQMIVCTHDSSLNLIDNFYIGKATEFDGTSHTIEYKLIDDNSLKFNHVNWGQFKDGNEFVIDTVKYETYTISVSENGKIKKKTMPNNV